MPEAPRIARTATEGPRHEVGPDDLFFSTTDARGVITDANEVFVRLSRHPREELDGAAHNIIRHPDMPGGAFRVMWDTLGSGEPFVAYVRNRAADGSAYDVLATVTPLPAGGFLSVRSRPCTGSFAEVAGVYREMNEAEAAAREAGANRRDAAVAGAARLGELLDGMGLSGYPELMWSLLPAEVAAWEAGSGLDVAGLAAANPTAAAAVRVYRALDGFMAAQEHLAAQLDRLKEASAQLERQNGAIMAVSARMDALDLDGPARTLLLAPLQVWTHIHDVVGDRVADLDARLGELDELTRRVRFRIALGRLHALMVARFAAAEEDRAESTRMLLQALDDGLSEMRRSVSRRRRLAARVADRSASLAHLLEVPRELVGSWLADTRPEALAEGAADLVADVREAVTRSDEAIGRLVALSADLGGDAGIGFEELTAAVGELGGAVRAGC